MNYNKNIIFEIQCFFQGLIISEMKRFYYIVMRIVMVKNYMMLIDGVIVVNIKWLDNKIMKVL